MTDGKLFSRQATIVNELGLHARSAAKIAKIARDSESLVWIIRGTDKVDASSIMDILTLACEKGSRITLAIDNAADMNILEAITALVDNGFGE